MLPHGNVDCSVLSKQLLMNLSGWVRGLMDGHREMKTYTVWPRDRQIKYRYDKWTNRQIRQLNFTLYEHIFLRFISIIFSHLSVSSKYATDTNLSDSLSRQLLICSCISSQSLKSCANNACSLIGDCVPFSATVAATTYQHAIETLMWLC